MSLGEGSQIGRRYRLLSQIGRGGMGKVWQAHDDLLHRDVAVKEVLFPPGLSASDREVLYERTLREARSAARLSHRGIVTVHDVVEEDGRPWIVMEYVRARSLQQVIDESGRLPAALVADIGVQVLAALRSAHAAGVLHRDVKPANVLLDTQDAGGPRAVITDFGIARVEGDSTLTQTGLVLGSPAYIAPERARGELATASSDLWALGATLYAAVEGRSPHDRAEAMAALNAVLTEEPPQPRHAGPLAPLLMGLLVKDPAYRVTSDQASGDLTRISRGLSARTPDTSDATMADVPDDRTVLDQATRVAEPWQQSRPHGVSEPESIRSMTVNERFGPGPTGHLASGAHDRRPGRKWQIVLPVALVVLLAVAAGAYLVYKANHSDASGSTSPSPSVSASPSPTPPPSPTASASPTNPPGTHRDTGPEGTSLAIPSGWARQSLGRSSVRWTEKATGAQIQVDSIPWGMSDPAEHWRRLQGEVVAKHRLPGYRSISLGDTFSARGWQAADWEYSWQSPSSGAMRAYDRGFTANGHQYALAVTAPSGRWTTYSGLLTSLFDSFQPAP